MPRAGRAWLLDVAVSPVNVSASGLGSPGIGAPGLAYSLLLTNARAQLQSLTSYRSALNKGRLLVCAAHALTWCLALRQLRAQRERVDVLVDQAPVSGGV